MSTVLIVDDLAVDRDLAGGLLKKSTDVSVQYAVNGVDALEKIENQQPDLVVTDLMMPEMDGLELVERVVERYPLVPVILMTGRGSEEIAVKALKLGASSYVPKTLLASLLVETVVNVLEAAREARCESRLMDCLLCSEMTFVLGNDASLVPPLVSYLNRTIRATGLCDKANGIRVSVALEEAISNAIFHGNLEVTSDLRTSDSEGYHKLLEERRGLMPYQDRTIRVEAKFTRSDATFTIRDQGPGFDPNSLPDPTDPENLEKASGRGLLLMRTFMDSVEFNSTGNEVTMVKKVC